MGVVDMSAASANMGSLMADTAPIQGELQVQIMAVVWRAQSGTVDQIRDGLPSRYRGAYTTVQTVLNRLVERGLLTRSRSGRSFVYAPKLTEAEYLSRSMTRTFERASSDARQAALAQFVGAMRDDELSELKRLTRRVSDARKAEEP
jgi:predicted transcriptional regulator